MSDKEKKRERKRKKVEKARNCMQKEEKAHNT